MNDSVAPSSANPVAYQDELVTIYHADSTRLAVLDDASVDLVVTSPPYNLEVCPQRIDARHRQQNRAECGNEKRQAERSCEPRHH